MLKAISIAAVAASAAAETFIPASDPRIWYAGRTQINADGSRSFDWEATSFYINTVKSSYVKVVMNATGGLQTRLLTDTQQNGLWFELSQVWVNGNNAGGSNEYLVASDLDQNTDYTIRVFNTLEPSFNGGSNSPSSFYTFMGFLVDGDAGPASAPLGRNIELIGDSISAGYGSLGGGPCPVNDWTSSNYYTYNHYLCTNFTANCTIIAWSGKGMYENCCDNGETMPSYYLQTRGGEQYSSSWDFSRFTPDAIIINLGTNDFGHDAGPAWEANFTNTYVEFVLNATTKHYNNARMPVFVAQGPMNNSANLYNALQNAIKAINAAGGNAVYLDMRGPPNDGCGGHPGRNGHMQMFEMAQPVIAATMGW